MSIIKKPAMLILIASLSACSSTSVPSAPVTQQQSYELPAKPGDSPQKPRPYELGLIDGCQSGMVGTGGSYVKRTDIHDKTYAKAWKDGYDYCKSGNSSTTAANGNLVLAAR